VATGIARASIDALRALADAKTPTGSPNLHRTGPLVQDFVGPADALAAAAHAYHPPSPWTSCDAVAAGKRMTPEQDARWRLAACYTTDNALEATGLIAFGVNAMTDVEQRHV
jgi:Acyl-CoA dehydrogenase, C-terminal domain